MLKRIVCLCIASLLITAGSVYAESALVDIAKEATIYQSGTVSGSVNDIIDAEESTTWVGDSTTDVSYRYIKVKKNTNEDGRNLGIREVAVMARHVATGEVVNLCRGTSPSGAFSWTGISPSQAVDGNEQSGGWFNQYCGTHELYWQVDLGENAKNYLITSVEFTLFNPHYASDGGDTNIRVELANSSDYKDALVLYKNTTKEKIVGKQILNIADGCVSIDENGTQITPLASSQPSVTFSFGSPKRVERISAVIAESAGFEVLGIPLDESYGSEVIYKAEEDASGNVDISIDGKSYTVIKIVSTAGKLAISDFQILTDNELAGLINVSLKKNVSGGENGFGVDPNCLVNGNLTDLAAAQNGNTAIDVDLGRRYPIHMVEIITGNPSNGGLPSHCMIYASNTPDFAEGENTVLLYEWKEGMSGRSIYSFKADGESYRYIRFTNAIKNEFVAVAEMSVYSKTEENIGTWQSTPSSISIDVENNSAERKGYTVIAYTADKDGVVYSADAASRGVLGKDTVSVNTNSFMGTNVQAILVDDARNFNVFCAPYGKASEDSAEVAYEKDITIPCEGEEFVSVSVIKPNRDGIKSFDTVSVYALKDLLYSVNVYEVAPGEKSINHRFVVRKGSDVGVYAIRVKSGENETYYYYNYVTPETEIAYLKEISETDTPKDLLKRYAEDYLLILSAEEMDAVEAFDSLFLSVKDEMYDGAFQSFDEVTKAVSYAIAMDTLQNGEATDVKAFLDVNSGIFEENAYSAQREDIQKTIAEKIVDIRENITTVQEAETLLNTAIALTLIEEGNVQDKAEVLKAYSDILGIDLEKAEKLGLSVTDVAKKIKGETKEEIVESFEAILEDAEEELEVEEEEPEVRPSRPSGGGGGGGVTYPVKPKEEKKEEETSEPEEEKYVPVFSDIMEDMWARPYVEGLHAKGIIAGDETGAFRPNDSVSRAEFVKMLTLAFDLKMQGDEKAFSDVTREDWYYSYVVTAFASGIVKGKSDDYFGATENITREDIAVMVQRALYMTSKDGNLSFADCAEIADYAKGAIFDLTNANIISGFEDNTFRPKGFATRAEAAAMISRAMEQNK